ncbi:hypothetical protein OE88DRAFT_1637731 [Heliocybe sulcata]|uniref:Transmembrane protein n=1 Tax=Heliocybe sulcata TaxID=5364 RepID=A0A5C3MNH7_9AGAM|nr:hypothetical protein OE88DRAFT_1637731 [Heliocybe sulcata]
MVDWNSQAELQTDAAVFTKFMHAILGLYAWEWFTSLDFDWEFIRGRKKFRWPMIFYFCGRYCLLIALIGIAIALDTTTRINCQALYTFNQLTGQATIGFASMNLAIRTMAIWSQRRYIVIPLVIVILGHWSLILQGIQLTATFVPGQGCAIISTKTTILSATFIYTMVFDLIVTVLTGYKLIFDNPGGQRSSLMNRIWNDGLIYFFIAFLSNAVATTFMLLNWNPVMSILFNVPSATASTIVACRAVRRLTNFASSGPEVLYVPLPFPSDPPSPLPLTRISSSSGAHSGIRYPPSATANRPVMTAVSVGGRRNKSDGVHVQVSVPPSSHPLINSHSHVCGDRWRRSRWRRATATRSWTAPQKPRPSTPSPRTSKPRGTEQRFCFIDISRDDTSGRLGCLVHIDLFGKVNFDVMCLEK